MVLGMALQQHQFIIRRPTMHNLNCRKPIRATIVITGLKPPLIQAPLSSTWEDLLLVTGLLRLPIATRSNLLMLEVTTGMPAMVNRVSSSSQAASNSRIAVPSQSKNHMEGLFKDRLVVRLIKEAGSDKTVLFECIGEVSLFYLLY